MQSGSYAYSSEDHLVWDLLYTRQVKTVEKVSYEFFKKGLKALDFDGARIPPFHPINEKLQNLTCWTIYPIPGSIDKS